MKWIVAVALVLAVIGSVHASGTEDRYFIAGENPVLKVLFGVNHEFPNGFTTNLNAQRLELVRRLGLKAEPVEVYQLSKPPAGCTPWPECKNGGGDPTPARKGYTIDSVPWGIEMVYQDGNFVP